MLEAYRSNLFGQVFPADRAARVAIVFEGRDVTYAQLHAQTLAIAGTLNAAGLRAGNRVAILLADSPEFVATFVAVISLGGIAVPINLALRREEQLFILKDCGAVMAIVEAPTPEVLFKGSATVPDLKKVFTVRGRSSITRIEVFELESAQQTALTQLPTDTPIDGDAFILYTSGSTGEPKGAVHSQRDIFYTNDSYCREVLNLSEGDRLFSSSRLPFAYGLGNSFTFPLLNGYTSILCAEKPTPEVISRVFSDARPTVFFGVPVVYRMLLEHHRNQASLDTSSLRLCISAGEALPASLAEDWQRTFGVEVLDGIGSTEMLHMFMSNHAGDLRYGSSGKLLSGYEARLIDHEGVPAQVGQEGNLWIRGNSAASRYWARPETSAETFVDGWTRTGDLYRYDSDGFWWHMGRADDCFKPTGQWVSPIEVENVLLRHAGVRAAAVVEGSDESGLSCVCAFIVAEGQAGDLEPGLQALCADALPRFKRPRRYLFVPELPYTATGKVQRFKLREQLRAQRAQSA